MTAAAWNRSLRRAWLPAALAGCAFCAACSSDDGPKLVRALVKVGARTVEVQTGGTAPSATSPTVVFEAGEGDDLGVWYKVAPLVAATNPVFLYSRAGYGQSTAVAGTRDGATILAELRATLHASNVPLPVIVVSHGNSGLYAELWAKSAPAEVAGVVMVEPRHRDFDSQCTTLNLDDCDVANPDLLPEPYRSEQLSFAATGDAVRALGSFGAIPLRVLTGTGQRNELVAWLRLWESLHQAEAKESTLGLWEGAPNSGHLVPITDPQVIANAVAEIRAVE